MYRQKKGIDLHIHSSYSDGAFSPQKLLQRANQHFLKTIAIADHDSIDAIPEALEAGKEYGIEVIPAVELSVQYKELQDVHLLAYGIDHRNESLKTQLDYFRLQRERRNELILERVNLMLAAENRLPVPLDEVTVFAHGSIGRPHIARALLEHHYVISVEDAFRRYLKPCNVDKQYWQIDGAIDAIKKCGGVAVLAHPTSISSSLDELRGIMAELLTLGLDGIEVFNNMAQLDEQEHLRRFAVSNNLLITAGSDFHGIEEGIEMGTGRGGIRFDASLLTPLKERLRR